jgi:hypothetical protein
MAQITTKKYRKILENEVIRGVGIVGIRSFGGSSSPMSLEQVMRVGNTTEQPLIMQNASGNQWQFVVDQDTGNLLLTGGTGSGSIEVGSSIAVNGALTLNKSNPVGSAFAHFKASETTDRMRLENYDLTKQLDIAFYGPGTLGYHNSVGLYNRDLADIAIMTFNKDLRIVGAGFDVKTIFKSDGRVGIGVIDPDAKLHVDGNIEANGNLTAKGDVTAFSDRRLKKNITEIVNGLDIVNRLRPVRFDRTDINKHQIGFIAQEVAEIEPSLVSGSNIYALNYQNMGALYAAAIQELGKQIEELKLKING